LGKGQQHVQHQAAHRGRGIELLGHRHEGDAMGDLPGGTAGEALAEIGAELQREPQHDITTVAGQIASRAVPTIAGPRR
jgi:hypothetical protein